VVVPVHRLVVPETALTVGVKITVMASVVIHEPMLYRMFTEPGATPPTTPVVLTVAVAVAELVHVPPLTASVIDNVLPVHTVGEAGKRAAGPGLTVTVLVT
jgi:hypothetical protein